MSLNPVVLIAEDRRSGMIRWKEETEGILDFGLSFANSTTFALRSFIGARYVRDRSDQSRHRN
jgi:hypothetical protein